MGAVLLAGCAAFQPPVGGDHASAKYQADLVKCRTQAAKHATQIANATPTSAVKAMFTSDRAEHDEATACMVGRGYPRVTPAS